MENRPFSYVFAPPEILGSEKMSTGEEEFTSQTFVQWFKLKNQFEFWTEKSTHP